MSVVTPAAPAVATASDEDCGPAPYSVDFKLLMPDQAAGDGCDLDSAT
jgi:hypothetical protein